MICFLEMILFLAGALYFFADLVDTAISDITTLDEEGKTLAQAKCSLLRAALMGLQAVVCAYFFVRFLEALNA